MNIIECQRKAIDADAADSAEFDLVSKGGRSRCRWEDADLGIFRVLDRPAHLKDQLLTASFIAKGDGFTIENFSAEKQRLRVQVKISLVRQYDLATIDELPSQLRRDGYATCDYEILDVETAA